MASMKSKYICRVATAAKSMNLSIHAASCAVVAIPYGKKFQCFPVEGATAREAAQGVYDGEDCEARGLKFPKICACAK
jgi:hypothetical protein